MPPATSPNQDEITIKLPVSGKSVVLRNYVTGADEEALTEVSAEFTEILVDENNKQSTKINLVVSNRIAEVKLARWVKSVEGEDGDSHKLVEAVRQMRNEDYKFVLAAIDKITAEIEPTQKKSETPNTPSSTTA